MGAVGRIDVDQDRADLGRGVLDERPLGDVRGPDPDAVAGPDRRAEQSERQRVDARDEIGVGPSATGRDIDERQWIDPEVQALCGISPEELQALTQPAPFERPAEPVPQPPYDEAMPNLHYPARVRDAIMGMADADVWVRLSEPVPPVTPD